MVRFLLIAALAWGCTPGDVRTPKGTSVSGAADGAPAASHPPPVGWPGRAPVPVASVPPLHLDFRVTHIYELEKPTEDPPGHVDGGDWLFFDAATPEGAPFFTFGFFAEPPAPGTSIAFGDASLSSADRPRFLAALAMAFAQPAPGFTSETIRKPLRFRLAVLGRGLGRSSVGGYSGTGNWTATKLLFESGSTTAEVFFSFDLKAKRGEFYEENSDESRDFVRIVSSSL
jgi:hypothetical protein